MAKRKATEKKEKVDLYIVEVALIGLVDQDRQFRVYRRMLAALVLIRPEEAQPNWRAKTIACLKADVEAYLGLDTEQAAWTKL